MPDTPHITFSLHDLRMRDLEALRGEKQVTP